MGFPTSSLGLANFPRIGQAEPITEPRDETIYTEHLGVTFHWTSSDTFLRHWRQRVEPKERKQHSWITPLHHLLRLLASLHAVNARVEIKRWNVSSRNKWHTNRTEHTNANSFRPVSLVVSKKLTHPMFEVQLQLDHSLIIAQQISNWSKTIESWSIQVVASGFRYIFYIFMTSLCVRKHDGRTWPTLNSKTKRVTNPVNCTMPSVEPCIFVCALKDHSAFVAWCASHSSTNRTSVETAWRATSPFRIFRDLAWATSKRILTCF